MYQAVFFDAWHTLFYIPLQREERVAHALERLGRQVDLQAVREAIDQVATELYHSPFWPLTSRRHENRWWLEYFRRLLERLGEDPAQAARVAQEALYTRYVETFPEVHDVLQTLHGQVRLGVISNAYPSLSEALDMLDLSRYFDTVINSSLVDAWKPDVRIFHIALEALDVPAEASVFVDDQPENVEVAERLGFTAFLIDRHDQYPDIDQKRISSLWPVVHLVQRSSG